MASRWYRGRSALVTGASSGIGEVFARELAARGMHLLLVGRSDERLRALAGELKAERGPRLETVRLDLGERDAARRLQIAADELRFEPDLLVNNAGLGSLGPFADASLERELEMVRVNVEALVALTGLYLPRMIARRSGAILNVGSTAAFQPIPHMATYAATKAFVLRFSEALWAEAGRHGVRVAAVCPGRVAETRFGERDAMKDRTEASRFFSRGEGITREAVVAAALRALERHEPVAVPGVSNKLLALAAGVAPRRLQLTLTERLFRPRQSPLPAEEGAPVR